MPPRDVSHPYETEWLACGVAIWMQKMQMIVPLPRQFTARPNGHHRVPQPLHHRSDRLSSSAIYAFLLGSWCSRGPYMYMY